MRRWRDADRGPFAAMCADPEVMRYFPAPLTRAESDALVDRIEARFAARGYGLWALDVDGDFIGFTGLGPMHPAAAAPGALEVGWRLARHAWGHGYATEAGRAALGVASAAGVDRVWSWTAKANEPSQAVMSRLGLVFDREADHPDLTGHPLCRHVFYRTPAPP